MGLSIPTTSEAATATVAPIDPPAGGLRGWFATLSPRDRAIYALMLGMLGIIMLIYLVAGVRALIGAGDPGQIGRLPSATPTDALVIGGSTPDQPSATQVATQAATAVPPTPTDLPTHMPEPTPTEPKPTQLPLLLPTRAPTSAVTVLPSVAPSPPPGGPSQGPARESTPGGAPLSTRPPTPAGAPPATRAPAPSITPRPASTPGGQVGTQPLLLYFADASGTLLVPVQQNVSVPSDQLAEAAVKALLAEPPAGLKRLLLPEARLLGIQISDGTATVNFDRRPAGAGDKLGLLSMMYTLVEFPSITRIQVQVNGQNIGIDGDQPIAWRPINALNPSSLPQDYSQTAFLPLYFITANGRYDVRVIRMIPKTTEVARATLNALLEGPMEYGNRLWSPIPDDTQLRSVKKDGTTLIVDLTQAFTKAPDHDLAVRVVVESLTSLPGVDGVVFLVDGSSLGNQWGANYGNVFKRPVINPI